MVVEDKVRTKLKALELFTRIRTMRTPGECDAGVQKTTDPAGGGFALQEAEAMTNTDTRLDIDAADRQETLTRQAGDTGE